MSKVEKYCPENTPCILVGNKCDLESQRKVSFEEGQELADQYCMRFFEISVKDSHNVERAFTTLAKEIMAGGGATLR